MLIFNMAQGSKNNCIYTIFTKVCEYKKPFNGSTVAKKGGKNRQLKCQQLLQMQWFMPTWLAGGHLD